MWVWRSEWGVTDNPAEYIRKPSIPRVSTTTGLTRSELLRCLDKAQQTDPQDHALWCVLAFNGYTWKVRTSRDTGPRRAT